METLTASIYSLGLKMVNSFPQLLQRKRGCLHHYLLAVVLMGLALLVRLAIAPIGSGLQYVTFFPAVTLAAIIGGVRSGLLATFIGLVLAAYVFTPPSYAFSLEVLQASFWGSLVFLMDGIIVSFSIEAMHRYREHCERRLIRDAHYDTLTGLANRHLLQEYLGKAVARADRGKRQLALFFIDLDGFKQINDTLGHHAGDQLLQQVAKRLQECVRSGDLVSRLGGDEFALIIEDSRPCYLETIAKKAIRTLELPYQLSGGQVAHISASIGISFYPHCATDLLGLIEKADEAMYEVKKHGKNGYGFSCGGSHADKCALFAESETLADCTSKKPA